MMTDAAAEKPAFSRVLAALVPTGIAAGVVAILLIHLETAPPPRKDPDPAEMGIVRVVEFNPAARALLGAPVAVVGGLTAHGIPAGRVALITCDWDVRGSHGQGRMHVQAQQSDGEIRVIALDLETADGRHHDLLHAAPAR